MQEIGLKEGLKTKCKKGASKIKIPLIKHEEGVKIRLFTVWTKAQKYKHKGLTKHAKIRPKEG